MKSVSSHSFCKLTVNVAAFALLMVFMPTAFAQGNLQIRAPQFEVIPANYAAAPAPQLQFVSGRVEQNIEVEGIKGVRLHINFIVQDASCPCVISALFYNHTDGTQLKGSYPSYSTPKGHAATAKAFTPSVNPAQYKDFTLWIPYKALNLGQHAGDIFDLRFQVNVVDNNRKRSLGKSKFYLFTLKFL